MAADAPECAGPPVLCPQLRSLSLAFREHQFPTGTVSFKRPGTMPTASLSPYRHTSVPRAEDAPRRGVDSEYKTAEKMGTQGHPLRKAVEGN